MPHLYSLERKNLIAEPSDLSFDHVRQQIYLYNPQAAVQLQTILRECGGQAAYYAAFVLMVIHARVEQHGLTAFRHLSDSEIRGYTFFEYVKGDLQALALFAKVFKTYQAEQEARFGAQSDRHD